MSEDFKFIKVPNKILEVNLNGNEVLFVLRIIRVAGFDREYYESRDKTAEAMGCHKDLVSACIKELQKLNVIAVTEGKRGLQYRLKINHPDQWQLREANKTNRKNQLPNRKIQLPNRKIQFVCDAICGENEVNKPENPVGLTGKSSYYKPENPVTPSTLDEVDLIEVDLTEVEIFAERSSAPAPVSQSDALARFEAETEIAVYKPSSRSQHLNRETLVIEAEVVDDIPNTRKTRKQARGETKAVVKPKGLPTPVTEAWRAYSEAFRGKYGVPPICNAKVMGQVKQFIERVGATDAPDILRFYLQQHDRWTVQNGHTVGVALQQAEKLAAGYRGARLMTEKEARRIDEKQTTQNILEEYEARKDDYFEV